MLIRYVSENLVRAQRFYVVRGEAPDNILGEWLPGVRYLEVKMYVKARWGREKCPLFGVKRWSLLGGS